MKLIVEFDIEDSTNLVMTNYYEVAAEPILDENKLVVYIEIATNMSLREFLNQPKEFNTLQSLVSLIVTQARGKIKEWGNRVIDLDMVTYPVDFEMIDKQYGQHLVVYNNHENFAVAEDFTAWDTMHNGDVVLVRNLDIDEENLIREFEFNEYEEVDDVPSSATVTIPLSEYEELKRCAKALHDC